MHQGTRGPLKGIQTQTLHGTGIFTYIGVVLGVNVGIYMAVPWSVWERHICLSKRTSF